MNVMLSLKEGTRPIHLLPCDLPGSFGTIQPEIGVPQLADKAGAAQDTFPVIEDYLLGTP